MSQRLIGAAEGLAQLRPRCVGRRGSSQGSRCLGGDSQNVSRESVMGQEGRQVLGVGERTVCRDER